MLTIDLDGDGLDVYNDCDDSNTSENTGDCDGDGIPIWNDCNDEDPNIWEMMKTVIMMGFRLKKIVTIKNQTGHTGLSESCAGTDCLSILEVVVLWRWFILDSSL